MFLAACGFWYAVARELLGIALTLSGQFLAGFTCLQPPLKSNVSVTQMLHVYCDTGAYPRRLKKYEVEGLVTVVQFKYENRNRRISNSAPPSNPTWSQMNYRWEEVKSDPILGKLSWDDIGQTSDRFTDIVEAIGKENMTDAQHIDSAFRAACDVFLTSDKDDIYSQRDALWRITNLKILHPIDDWDYLVSMITLQMGGAHDT